MPHADRMAIGDLSAITAGLLWSISVILMRVSGYRIDPLPLNFFKNSVAILCLIVVLLVHGGSWQPPVGRDVLVRLVISSVIGISLADVMIAAALNRLGASLHALADCAYSPSVAAVGFVMFGEVLSAWEMIGGALVISGVFVGATMTAEVKRPRDLWTGVALAAGAHILMAVAILMVRDVYRETSIVWVTLIRFGVATLALFLWAVLRHRKAMPRVLFAGFRQRDTWRTMIPMAFFGPFLATLFWVNGFKHLTAGRAAIYNQLSTVFIIGLAYLFLRERFTKRKAIGTGLALTGSLLVALNRQADPAAGAQSSTSSSEAVNAMKTSVSLPRSGEPLRQELNHF